MGPRTEQEKGNKQIWRVSWPAPRTAQSTSLHSLISRSNGILRTNSWSSKAAAEPEKGEAASTWAAGVASFPP